jgi:aconitate hydratase
MSASSLPRLPAGLENLLRDGYLEDLLASGARLMENACGFCIGSGQSPRSDAVSLRTSNRISSAVPGRRNARVYW